MSQARPMPEDLRTLYYWRQNFARGAKKATGWSPVNRLTPRQRQRIDHKAKGGRA